MELYKQTIMDLQYIAHVCAYDAESIHNSSALTVTSPTGLFIYVA